MGAGTDAGIGKDIVESNLLAGQVGEEISVQSANISLGHIVLCEISVWSAMPRCGSILRVRQV